MTVREFKNILERADQNLTIAFEWDGAYSQPELPAYVDKEFLVFCVDSYGSAEGL